MKTFIALALTTFIYFSINAQTIYKGEPFTKIRISDWGNVIVKQDSVFSIITEGDNSILGGKTIVKNGTLQVSSYGENKIRVSLPVLEQVTIDGHGSVKGESLFTTDKLTLNISGDGKINLEVAATTIDVKISGVGKIVLSGRTQEANFSIPGAGKIDGLELKAIRCHANISGIGKCLIDVIDELNTSISGNGKVVYKTFPKKATEEISGMGSVKGINESEKDDDTGIENKPCIADDTTRLVFGKKQIWIFGGTDSSHEKKESLKPIWAGFEMGINSFMDNGGTLTLSSGKENFDLRTEKSISVALNVLQYDVQLGKSNIWLLTGLGITWNNYRFDNKIILEGGSFTKAIVDTTSNVKYLKSKLTTSYLTAPVMLQVYTSKNIKKAFHLGGGAMLGLRIGSHTKRKIEVNDDIVKIKDHDDFNLNPFRVGFRFVLGYGKLNLFADYYASTLFKTNKGPVLFPVNAGITLVGF